MQSQAYITPRNLVGVNQYEQENQMTLFCWRYINANDQNKYRVVTIEDVNFCHITHMDPPITPLDLQGTNNYNKELNKKTGFCWRWKTRDKQKFRVVTLEDGNKQFISQYENSISPKVFCGTSDYHKDITDYFCWRWITADNNNKYRVLTIE